MEHLSQGLDYYKATMGQLEYEKHPDVSVTFSLINRSANQLSEFVEARQLKETLAELQNGWSADEIAYLASIESQNGEKQFTEEYLDFLADHSLPPIDIERDDNGELSLHTTGPWPLVTFWETVAMSAVNELYFANKLSSEGRTLDDLYAEGDRRLDEKIALLKTRPDIRFSDFGTRRRFSYNWQHHVLERLATELPNNFIGTSNIYLSYELDLAPIGTFAHEMPMVYAAIEDRAGNNPLLGHSVMMRDWQDRYPETLSTALTDTFTSDFFLTDTPPEMMKKWKAFRHDSGDPFDFGDKLISTLSRAGIDPMEKTIVFSDGLDIETIIMLADYFKDRVNLMFGWGTTLTNDLGLPANNFVMKATAVEDVSTVKLSDVATKHTGSPRTVERYEQAVKRAINMGSVAWQEYCSERRSVAA